MYRALIQKVMGRNFVRREFNPLYNKQMFISHSDIQNEQCWVPAGSALCIKVVIFCQQGKQRCWDGLVNNWLSLVTHCNHYPVTTSLSQSFSKTSESPHWKRLLALKKKRKLPSLTTTTKTSYLALSKVTQQLSPFTLWLLSAVKNTEQSEHQYSLLWLQKFPWKPFFPPFFLSYLNLQRTRQGQSLHWKALSLCMSDIRVPSPPESHNLDTFLGNCLEFYLPAVKVSEQLLSPLDSRCCGWILSPPSFQPVFHLRTQFACCRLCTNPEHRALPQSSHLWRDRADKSNLITPTYMWKTMLVSQLSDKPKGN